MDIMTAKSERLMRERDFHNDRFAEETRENQHKFYFAVESIFARYRDRVSCFARGSDVLEYGCSFGNVGRSLTGVARSVQGIDVSDIAVAEANRRAAQHKLQNPSCAPCDFHVMDAHAMDFADNSFDVVFGSGIIHHLDIDAAFAEIRRVLRPGGRCVFIEPLGGNPIFDLYRKLTPAARTIDEMPLRTQHVSSFESTFATTQLDYAGLSALASVPLRNGALGRHVRAGLELLDGKLFALPFFQRMAWFVILEGQVR